MQRRGPVGPVMHQRWRKPSHKAVPLTTTGHSAEGLVGAPRRRALFRTLCCRAAATNGGNATFSASFFSYQLERMVERAALPSTKGLGATLKRCAGLSLFIR